MKEHNKEEKKIPILIRLNESDAHEFRVKTVVKRTSQQAVLEKAVKEFLKTHHD